MDINPYLLEGSGSLLIVSPDGYKIEESLNANGIYGEVIGKITDNKNRVVINGDETRYLEPPRGDEIYLKKEIGNERRDFTFNWKK